MASIYKNNGTWYISLGYNRKRKSKSLKTKDYNIALKLKPFAESLLIDELTGLNNQHKELSFEKLSAMYLKQSSRSINTHKIYENAFKNHILQKPHPHEPISGCL